MLCTAFHEDSCFENCSLPFVFFSTQEATKFHGITSVEAQLAWEEVDDIENKGGAIHVKTLSEKMANTYETFGSEEKVKEFEKNMASLEQLTSAAKAVNTQIKSEIRKLQSLKMGGGTLAAAAAVSTDAYKNAKAAAEKCTPGSPEAAVAWEAVFEIVSAADDDKVSMGSLADECLVESSEKCEQYNAAMEELQKSIAVKK